MPVGPQADSGRIIHAQPSELNDSITRSTYRHGMASGRESPLPRTDWFAEIVPDGVTPDRPGLYEWRIEGVGCYIGQYSNCSRPRSHYARNLRRLLLGLPYRRGKPGGSRRVHQALALGLEHKAQITLTFLENHSAKHDRNRREREVLRERIEAMRRGGLPVLNVTAPPV